MLEPFFLAQNTEAIENHWRQKSLISSEIMGKSPLRSLRPDLLGDRSRLDLMWNGKNLGIRGPSTLDNEYDFYTIENPDTPQPPIQNLLKEFLLDPPPLPLSQVRFRVGSAHLSNNSLKPLLGIWFDTSNENILRFLEQGDWISRWLDKGLVIEAGQKQKEIQTDPHRGLKLVTALPRPWLPSFDIDNNEILLKSRVCQFSQPGPESNRALFAASYELLDEFKVPKEIPWIEWGAGYGNLSAGFYTRLGTLGMASEIDPGASESLELNRNDFFKEIKVECRPAEKAIPEGLGFHPEIWLLDPPRPGFGKLLERLLDLSFKKPQFVFTLHCHSSGLISDTSILKKAGYSNLAWSSVDTFPATPHFEVISIWEKTS
jgi:hypothetical protein